MSAASSSRCSAGRRQPLAAGGARAAVGPHATHRCARASPRTILNSGPRRGVPAGPAAIGLDQRPQRADRLPLVGRRCRAKSQRCNGIGRARAGRHSGYRRRTWGHCNRRPARYRSCSRSSPIRWAPALSRAWRGRAATSPASPLRIWRQREMDELLKEIAPRVTRVAVLRDSAITSGTAQFAAIQALAPSFGME